MDRGRARCGCQYSARQSLFADRTVDLLRGQGIDARRPKWPADGRFRAPRVRLERIRRGLATDVFFHMYGQRHLGRTGKLAGTTGGSDPHPVDRR